MTCHEMAARVATLHGRLKGEVARLFDDHRPATAELIADELRVLEQVHTFLITSDAADVNAQG